MFPIVRQPRRRLQYRRVADHAADVGVHVFGDARSLGLELARRPCCRRFVVVVDLAFVSANMMKVFEGGWFPLMVAAIVFFLMTTWRKVARRCCTARTRCLSTVRFYPPGSHQDARARHGRLYDQPLDVVPVPLLHNLKHNKVLHERIVLLHVVTANVPRVPSENASRPLISATISIREGAL